MNTAPSPAPERLASLDAYRGFVMFLMAAEILRISEVAAHYPDHPIWKTLSFHTQHVDWTGCSLHDLIQPSFSFMVGVALPFSLANRAGRSEPRGRLWLHALWRSLLLVLLGVALRSVGEPMTHWTFEDTLSQIGLGYPFLFALGFMSQRTRWLGLTGILVGYWLLFVLYQPAPDWSATTAAVPRGWAYDFAGFAAHWNLNHNAAWAFDRWFLNVFPRKEVFLGNDGGYSTLNFIPTLGTMVLGLIAGQWLKDRAHAKPTPKLLIAAVACLTAGGLLDASGLCPAVKKIWTPAWTLLSGGWCLLLMAIFYLIIDVVKWRAWALPLVVIGMNSIAMYVMAHLFPEFFDSTLRTHLGQNWADTLVGPILAPLLSGGVVLLILWLILWWMYRRRLFLKI